MERYWDKVSDQNEAEQYMLLHSNANLIKQGDEVILHVVSDVKPFEDAVIALPTLEDVYMYYFDESSTDSDKARNNG